MGIYPRAERSSAWRPLGPGTPRDSSPVKIDRLQPRHAGTTSRDSRIDGTRYRRADQARAGAADRPPRASFHRRQVDSRMASASPTRSVPAGRPAARWRATTGTSDAAPSLTHAS